MAGLVHFTKSVIKPIFYGKKIPNTERYKASKILKEGDFFLKNQPILNLSPTIHGSGNAKFSLPFNGQIKQFKFDEGEEICINDEIVYAEPIKDNEHLYSELLKQNLIKLNKTDISILKDDFTHDKSIKFTKVSGEQTPYFKIYGDSIYDYLGITYICLDKKPYISFISTNDDLKLDKGDSIIILFENKERLIFEFKQNGKGRGLNINHSNLTEDRLNKLLKLKADKIKVTNNKTGKFTVYLLNHNLIDKYDNNIQYSTKMEAQYLLQKMTAMLIELNLSIK